MKKINQIIVAAALLAALPGVASATNRALIIAASRYDNLADALQLRGPYNDARRVRETLLQRGFDEEHITILANCPADADSTCEEAFPDPTREAILGAFSRLLEVASTGDQVFLHLAGHGSQQPVPAGTKDGDEVTDDLDEIFLPSDVGRWNGAKAAVENALTDNEIGAWVTRLRNAGVFVVAVFDTCHSGTMLRATHEDYERERGVDAVADLGVPSVAVNDAVRTTSPGSERSGQLADAHGTLVAGAAGFAALYASQPEERTPELRLPAGQEPRQVHGLFTFTLMQVIDGFPQLTYRQAAEQVLARYESMNRPRPVPMFEGSQPDSQIFAAATPEARPQWPLVRRSRELTIAAGTLHEIGVGSRFLMVPDSMAPDTSAYGLVEVTQAGLRESVVRAIPDPALPMAPAGASSDRAYARLYQRALTLRLRVSLPPDLPENRADAALLGGVLDRARVQETPLIEWVPAGQPADVRLLAEQGSTLRLLPSDGGLQHGVDSAMRVTVAGDNIESAQRQLLASLTSVARVLNLLRVADDVGSVREPLIETQLRVSPKGETVYKPLAIMPRMTLRDGDGIEIQVRNTATIAVDITVLAIDARFGISTLFPTEGTTDNRLDPGKSRKLRGKVRVSADGIERLMIIATVARREQRVKFDFLEQDPLQGEWLSARRARLHPVEKLIAAAGLEGGVTRGVTPADAGDTDIRVFVWQVAR